jgi:hypothetical protein
MSRETVALALLVGAGAGLLWGTLSLFLWTENFALPGVVMALLWLTAFFGERFAVDPTLLGGAVSAALGLAVAAVVLTLPRLRGA